MTKKRFLRNCFIGAFCGIFLTSIILFIIGRRTTFVNVSLILGGLIFIISLFIYMSRRFYCKDMIKKYEMAYSTIKDMHALRYKYYLGGQKDKINEITKLIEKHVVELIEAGELVKTYKDMTPRDIEEIEKISEKILTLKNTIIPPAA